MPTNPDISVIALKIKQFKKDSTGAYQLAGWIMRDYIVKVVSPVNSKGITITPLLSSSTNTLITCQDENIDFAFNAYAANDSVNVQWDNPIKGATLSRSGNKFTIAWKPDSSFVRDKSYPVLITATDTTCPFPKKTQSRFEIFVKRPFSKYTYSYTDSSCGRYYFRVKHDTAEHFKYMWLVDGKKADSSARLDYTFPGNGTYIVELRLISPAGCARINYQTIKVNSYPTADAGKDTTICGGGVQLKASGGSVYRWHDTTHTLSDTTIANPFASPKKTTRYYLQVIDSTGCSDYDTVTVRVEDYELIKNHTLRYCRNQGKKVILRPTQYPNTEYRWWTKDGKIDTFIYLLNVGPSVTTTYFVTAYRDSGCIKIDSVVVYADTVVAEAGTSTPICPGESIQLHASGGATYRWLSAPGLGDGTVADPYVRPTTDQVYKVIAFDTTGCYSTDSVLVRVKKMKDSLIKNINPICPGDTISLSAGGGTNYNWRGKYLLDSTGAMPRIKPLASTWYFVAITDTALHCSMTDSVFITVQSSCVWPGDANNDRLVDYRDLLYIGVGYNTKGYKRSIVSTDWQAFPSKDWAVQTLGGLNYKYFDCNGDSVVDARDTIALNKNYAKYYDTPLLPQHPKGKPTDPALYFQLDQDSFFSSDTITGKLLVGSGTRALNNSYGIGIVLQHGGDCIAHGSFSLKPDQSLFCSGNSCLELHRKNDSTDVFTIVRTDQKNINGWGTVGTFSFILKDTNTFNYDTLGTKLRLSIKDVVVIDKYARFVPVFGKDTSLFAFKVKKKASVSSVKRVSRILNEISIFPNPATSSITVQSPGVNLEEVKVLSQLGQQIIIMKNIRDNTVKIPISNLAPGLYFITIETQEGAISRKIIVQH